MTIELCSTASVGESILDDIWSIRLIKKEWLLKCVCERGKKEKIPVIKDFKRVVDFSTNNNDFTE